MKYSRVKRSLLEDVNAAVQTISTVTITETNKLMYTTATEILEMLSHKMHTTKKKCPAWRRRFVAKIRATRGKNQLSELQRSGMKSGKKYRLSITEGDCQTMALSPGLTLEEIH